MFNKYMGLNNIQKQKYEEIQEVMKNKKIKDKGLIFDKILKNFYAKYNLDIFFFGENFFQKLADEYRGINKRAVEYYNNTNKEISVSRIAMLRKYGFQNDKDYKEVVQFDKSKEIIGLPNYLNPEKSLKVIKRKLIDPFVSLYNMSFFEKACKLIKAEMVKVKSEEIPLVDANGRNHFEEALSDMQTIMLSFLYLRLNACEIVDLSRIAFGRMDYNEFREYLKDELERRNQNIMRYTLKQETLERFKKIGRVRVKHEVKKDYALMHKEYIQNKNAVFGYRKDYDYDRTLAELQINDIKSYGQRITYLQLFKAERANRGLFYKLGHSFEGRMISKYNRMLPLRYINIDKAQMYNDVKDRDFKSKLTYDYEAVCDSIEDSITTIGMLLNYTYNMDPEEYNSHMITQLSDIEIDLRRELNLTDDDYEEMEDAMIRESLGPQYLVGYQEEAEPETAEN